MTWLHALLTGMLVIGVFFNAVGVLGILRFPDVYSRLHAETKTTTLGTIFTSLSVGGYALHQYFSADDAGGLSMAVHILVALFLLGFTNATGSHAIAQSAYARGQKPLGAVVDALASRDARRPEEKP
jgi:multicomponent Na+:H+ antiporter subunit G